MSKPEDHLIRTAASEAGMLALSAMTGLERLDLALHRLSADEQLSSAAGRERFLYVLEGAGSLRTDATADGGRAALGAGDFVALAADESAELHTKHGISFLLGQSGSTPRS